MILALEKIKQGIVHPEPLVRQQALNYFAEAWSTDTTVMPLAVQAFQKFGWHAFRWLDMLADLPQTTETLLWFISELQRAEAEPESWTQGTISFLSKLIASADVALLREHQDKILELAELDYDAEVLIKERVRLSLQDSQTCWQQLEKVCGAARGGDHEAVDIGLAELLTEAIARDGRSADRVLSLLSATVEANDDPMQWMQGFAVRLAGEMRLQAAIPALIKKFEVDELFGHEDATTALGQIGGDATVEAVYHDFAKHPRHYRYHITAALEHIRSPLLATRCLRLSDAEDDKETRQSLLVAALNNFASEAIEPSRRLASEKDTHNFRERLIGVALLMDISFPELAEWKQGLEDESLGIRKQPAAAPQWTAPVPAPPSIGPPLPGPMRPIKAAPQVGRNDPCPCGSGKKYKKCCLNNG